MSTLAQLMAIDGDASPLEIDLEAILAPIPGDNPAGLSLRYAGDYERIREARREDDASLPQGVWQTETKRADWDKVVGFSIDALIRRSKDLQIAAWLLEALIHRDGFTGITAGLCVIIGLCDTFWPTLHPEIEEGDLSPRLAPFEWINEKLAVAVYQLPLTEPGIVTPHPLTWSDHANAMRLDQIRLADPENRTRVSGLRLDQFDAAVSATATPFYRGIRRRLLAAQNLLDELDRRLDERCGEAAPSLARFRSALQQVEGLVQTILRNRGETPMIDETARRDATLPEPDDAAEADPGGTPFDGTIRDRGEAYRLIIEIAEFLAEREPHSLTPYLLRRAYTWGMMPLHELLGEMTAGNKEIGVLFDLLGLDQKRTG